MYKKFRLRTIFMFYFGIMLMFFGGYLLEIGHPGLGGASWFCAIFIFLTTFIFAINDYSE